MFWNYYDFKKEIAVCESGQNFNREKLKNIECRIR